MIVNSNHNCAICEELRGVKGTRLSVALADDQVSNAILMLSDHFAVIPSVGPLVVGHTLVVTREHSNNVMMSLCQRERHELRNVCDKVMEALLDAPEFQLLCFEHGSRCELEHSLCSTVHGHLHQLPLSKDDSMAVLNAVGGQSFEVSDFEEVCELLAPLQEYIVAFSLVPGRSTIQGVALDAHHIPSQYLRRLVADQVGIAGWDWKVNTNFILLRRTLALGFELNKKANLGTVASVS